MPKPIKKVKQSIVGSLFTRIKRSVGKSTDMLKNMLNRRPLAVITGLFVLTLVLIVAGSVLRKGAVEKPDTSDYATTVSVYRIGSVPKIRVQAKIEKDNVVRIVAQTSGIVNEIPVSEGNSVYQGQTLVWLSSNYQGANALSIQRQIAQTQYENSKVTLPLQKELLDKQRKIAEKNATNADELRAITEASLSETRSLISLNEEIIQTLDAQLSLYSATNSAGSNSNLITSTKQLKSQYQSGLNQLKSALRNSEYQADGSNPPGELNTLQKELVLKQLEIQEKSIELGAEISALQYRLAVVTESLMYPASPIEGVVERVHVQKGQLVSPGTVLVTVSGATENVHVLALVSRDVAERISRLEESTLILGKNIFKVVPEYISTEATEGTLYSVLFRLEGEGIEQSTNGEYIEVHIPVGYPDTGKTVPFVPLDAIYITNESASVLLLEKGKAREQRVSLGSVYGEFVEVTHGLKDKDQIILDRTVIAGDSVDVQK